MGGLHLCTLMTLVSIVVIAHGSSHTASPPKITQAPKNKKVAEDGTVSFICKASGNPAPAFHWERGGKKINDRRQRFEISDAPHITVLRIKQAKAGKDDGTFTCVANNGLGEAKSDASLKIYPKVDGNDDFPSGYPRIETHPKLRSVEKDRSVLLQCDVKGDPKPTITWLKDGFPVDDTDPRIQILETGYLQIRNSQESDEATYECVAENEWGVAYSYRAMIYIKVRRIAPKFTTAPEDVKIMPNTDVNLTCIAVGSPVPFVKWRQGALDLTGDDNIPIGRNTLTLSSVKESANYTCEASSDLGNIEHHVQVIVEAPGSPPENVLARAASATTVVVTWDEPKIPNGIIQGYKVFYTQQPGEPIFFWDHLEVKSDTRLATITDLIPNVTYSITVLAYSSIGQGPMSHPIQVLTTQGAVTTPATATPVNTTEASTDVNTTEASTTAQTSTTSSATAQTVRQDFECHLDYMFVFIPVDLVPNSQLTLRDPSCRLINNGTHHKISLDYDECGTSQSFYEDYISVENDVNVHNIFNDTAEITFVEDYKIPLRCSVDRSKLVNGIQVLPRESIHESVVQSTDFNMKEFTTKDYNQEITEYPVKLPINREIFFEIALANSSTNSTGIFVEKCEATPSINPNDTVRVSLIHYGCSVIPAVKVLPAPGIDRFRFSIQAFHFSGPANVSNMVYVHCSASTCGGLLCDNPCLQSSRRRKRSARGRASTTLTSGSHVVS